MSIKGARVLVAGGAGFLGSHLCDRLIAEGADVICLDNFFTGSKRNISHLIGKPNFELIRHDLVQPIFLEKKAGYTRCVVCHSEGRVGFLQPLDAGATTWTDEQARENFEAVSRLVMPGDPLSSRLLMHPLEPDAGGDEFHNGGRQFPSQDDPWFQTLAAWVRGERGN